MAASGVNSVAGSGVQLLVAPSGAATAGVRYGFTTRRGGVSPAPRDSLCLAVRPGSDADEIRENWRRVVAALGADLDPAGLAVMSQVHGATVLRVEQGAGPLEAVGEADGAWTTAAGVVLAVRTADCVPVVLMHPDVVGVAHAGWRGTAAGVVPATVRALTEGAGVAPSGLTAVIGPCISGAAYEVGEEVVEGLRAAGLPDAAFLVERDGPRPHVDLGAAVEAQLRGAGLTRVHRVRRCTLSDPDLFSHRGDGPATGRLAGVVVRGV